MLQTLAQVHKSRMSSSVAAEPHLQVSIKVMKEK